MMSCLRESAYWLVEVLTSGIDSILLDAFPWISHCGTYSKEYRKELRVSYCGAGELPQESTVLVV